MNAIVSGANEKFVTQVPLLIVGAGAAGLCAALAAKESGLDVLMVERNAVPAGSTALSAGLIPAAGTRFQRAKGIADGPDLLVTDIHRKSRGEADPAVVAAVAQSAAPLVEWLADRHGLPFDVVDNFNYPGHSALRMHCLPSRTGRELIDCLRQAAEAIGIEILTESAAETLFVDHGCIRGVEALRRNKIAERIGCDALILACNGFGGNPDLVRRFIPEMSDALYFGHPGNQGDAIKWGESLGAMVSSLGAYQGHGSVATPHNILISWAVIMQGGIQINNEGRRFCDETRGYSEQAAEVLRQPGRCVWNIFDERIAKVARQFEDFHEAERAGAIRSAESIADLAAEMHVPTVAFAAEWDDVENLKSADGEDRFGRKFLKVQGCKPPYHAVKVTGALFHTQGGLAVDSNGRVKRKDGTGFPNLFAVGGAAAGVSGSTAGGYLSGNGLLTATTLGYLAGKAAAEQALPKHKQFGSGYRD